MLCRFSEGASTQCLKLRIPNTIEGMVLGTWNLKYAVLGASEIVIVAVLGPGPFSLALPPRKSLRPPRSLLKPQTVPPWSFFSVIQQISNQSDITYTQKRTTLEGSGAHLALPMEFLLAL